MKPGDTFAGLSPSSIKYSALSITQDPAKQMVTASLEITKNGKPFANMYPARWFFVGHEQEPTTEVALRRMPSEDLYLVLASFETADQSANFQVHINPLVNWVWLGSA